MSIPSKTEQEQLAFIGQNILQVAHQIRTPLSSAKLYAEHLSSFCMENDKILPWITNIQDSLASMERQIQDLLLLARGERIKPECVDLQRFITKLRQRADELCKTQGRALQFAGLAELKDFYLHEEALMGAILNLVTNALQSQATCIKISIGLEKNESLVIVVADNGCGMSEEVRCRAGTPFFTTKTSGSGLGLSVVAAVVKAHGGEVVLESSLENGCRILISLPNIRTCL